MAACDPIVLVHGAWQGSWAFEAWLPHLRAHGWQPHAVDLPGNGWGTPGPATLAAYAEHVGGVVESLHASTGEPVVLLGHSGGGVVATAVAQQMPQHLRALVYLVGMMLPTGLGYAELVRQMGDEHPGQDFSGIAHRLRWSADRTVSEVPPDAAREIFLHDCDEAAAREAAARLRPQAESGRALVAHWTAERLGRVPRIYVEALQDRSVALPLQRRMQALVPGAHRISLDCGHVPQLARPAELTERLDGVLRELGRQGLIATA